MTPNELMRYVLSQHGIEIFQAETIGDDGHTYVCFTRRGSHRPVSLCLTLPVHYSQAIYLLKRLGIELEWFQNNFFPEVGFDSES